MIWWRTLAWAAGGEASATPKDRSSTLAAGRACSRKLDDTRRSDRAPRHLEGRALLLLSRVLPFRAFLHAVRARRARAPSALQSGPDDPRQAASLSSSPSRRV